MAAHPLSVIGKVVDCPLPTGREIEFTVGRVARCGDKGFAAGVLPELVGEAADATMGWQA